MFVQITFSLSELLESVQNRRIVSNESQLSLALEILFLTLLVTTLLVSIYDLWV